MRILVLTNMPLSSTYDDGFAPRYHAFVKALAAVATVDVVEIIPPNWPQARHPADEQTGARRVVRLPGRQWAALGDARRRAQVLLGWHPTRSVEIPGNLLRAQLSESQPQLVVALSADVVPTALRCGLPGVYVLDEAWERSIIHSWDDPSRLVRAWLDLAETARYRAMYRRIKRQRGTAVAIAEHESEWLAKFLDDVVVLPHAIDTEFFSPHDTEQDLDVLVVGHLGQQRNLVPTLAYFTALEAERPLRWGLVGRTTPAELTDLASDRVLVPGFVEDVRPWYARAKVVTVPSFVGAGVKTTLLQSWAMGRPTVTTGHGSRGVPAVADDNVLVASDTQGLVQQTLRLLDDPVLRDHVGAAGRATVTRERDVDVVAERFAALCLAKVSG